MTAESVCASGAWWKPSSRARPGSRNDIQGSSNGDKSTGRSPAALTDPALRPIGLPGVKRDLYLVYHRALRGSSRIRAVGRFAAECVASAQAA